MSVENEYLSSATYIAPFGRRRMYELAKKLSLRYLYSTDLLIGIIGAEGAGKSTLIRGLFPGLELTNEDDGINNPATPLFDFSENDFFSGHTFHIDVRYETAFRQMYEIRDAVVHAVSHGRRVIVEHFDLLYKALGYNAQLLFAISDEVRVFRPTVFGPSPIEVRKEVMKNMKYRLMAHSAEDITLQIIKKEYGETPDVHSNVRHGFVIGFRKKPKFSLTELEKKVLEIIGRDVPIQPVEGQFIKIDGEKIHCTGQRIHVSSSKQIKNFRIMKRFRSDPITKEYFIVAIVGREYIEGLGSLPYAGERFD